MDIQKASVRPYYPKIGNNRELPVSERAALLIAPGSPRLLTKYAALLSMATLADVDNIYQLCRKRTVDVVNMTRPGSDGDQVSVTVDEYYDEECLIENVIDLMTWMMHPVNEQDLGNSEPPSSGG